MSAGRSSGDRESPKINRLAKSRQKRAAILASRPTMEEVVKEDERRLKEMVGLFEKSYITPVRVPVVDVDLSFDDSDSTLSPGGSSEFACAQIVAYAAYRRAKRAIIEAREELEGGGVLPKDHLAHAEEALAESKLATTKLALVARSEGVDVGSIFSFVSLLHDSRSSGVMSPPGSRS